MKHLALACGLGLAVAACDGELNHRPGCWGYARTGPATATTGAEFVVTTSTE